MNEAAIRKSLYELNEVMTSLSVSGAAGGKGGSDGLYISSAPPEKRTAEEIIDSLRVQVKYLLFDLEATRRENRYLRRMLETRSHPNSELDGGSEI